MEAIKLLKPENARVESQPATTGYVGEIDALRCLAMTAVVAQHCGLLPFGWTGVWLFFVISGFAITSSMLASDRRSPHSRTLLIRNFYVRRCLRIWPLYFAYVAANMVVAAANGRGDVLASGPWLAGFVYNYRMMLHPESWSTIGHLWTISIEEQFYLVFPFLFTFLTRRRLVKALGVCIALSLILRVVLTCWFNTLPIDSGWKAFSLYAFGPAQFDAFSAGVLLALFRSRLASRLPLARLMLVAALAAAAIYAGVYVCINRSMGEAGTQALRNVFSGILWGQGRQIWLYCVVDGLAAAMIALILAGEPWLVAACRLPLLQSIGRISYGAYIFQLPAFVLYETIRPASAAGFSVAYALEKFAFSYAVTVLLAFLSFHYFEQPILRLRKRFA
jgi:peptidoglycan/LPS O-acetylase OafA/YrhL